MAHMKPVDGPLPDLIAEASGSLPAGEKHRCLLFHKPGSRDRAQDCRSIPGIELTVINRDLGIPFYRRKDYAPFPFPPDFFHIVIVDRVLETIVSNPSHFLLECHRVLEKNGKLIVRAARANSHSALTSLLNGHSFYPPFTHVSVLHPRIRAFTGKELIDLLVSAGFTMEPPGEGLAIAGSAPTGDEPEYHADLFRFFSGAPPFPGELQPFITCRAIKEADGRYAFPAELYRYPALNTRAYKNYMRMGENDRLQLGRGWYYFEAGPPPMRWTGAEATLHLRVEGTGCIVSMRCLLPPLGDKTVLPQVRVEGHLLELHGEKCNEWQTLWARLPPLPAGLARVTITACELYRPLSHGSEDQRALGLGVSEIRIHEGHSFEMSPYNAPGLGEGWHDLEYGDICSRKGYYRWSCKKALIYLFPRGGESMVIMTCHHPPVASNEIAVTITDEEGTLLCTGLPPRPEWHTWSSDLAKPAGVTRVAVSFEVPRTWKPRDIYRESNDPRDLGMALSSIRLVFPGETDAAESELFC